VALVACAALALLAASTAPASTGSVNTTSTRKFLEAHLAYDTAIAADASEMAAAGSAFSAQIARECGGVLASVEKRQEGPAGAAKRFGERRREREQSGILEEELSSAIEQAVFSPLNPAFASYRAILLELPWEDPAIGPALSAALQRDAEGLAPPPPVCADALAWVRSGYRLLSESTKRFLAASVASRTARDPAGIATLRRLDTHAERSLLDRLEAAKEAADEAAEKAVLAAQGSWSAIGLPHSSEREGPREIVRGGQLTQARTAAGRTYFVNATERPHARRCRTQVTVLDLGRREGQIERCVDHVTRAQLTVPCFERERAVLAVLPARVRSVRLGLSNGRLITSPTVQIPPRLGGPAAVYYRAVPASAAPATLTELDVHRHPIAVVDVPSASRCVKHGVTFIPRGIQPLARLQLPGGERATIKGEAFVYKGPVHFSIGVDLSGGGSEGVGMNGARPKLLLDAELNRCYPVPWELVYGVLKAPGDRVLARTARGETPLAQAPIPKRLNAGGVLVYGLFTEPLQSLVVEDAHGHELLGESFAANSKFHREYCEGFIEPGRAPQQDSSLF
jgi:hypothetical protein